MKTAFTFHTKGQPVTIYPINTGTVSMKRRAFTARRSNLLFRLIDIMRDKEFTEELPVLCWVVDHPEGVFIIDMGYDNHVNTPGYFSKATAIEKWFTRTQVRVKMRKEDELVYQLDKLGMNPERIKAVVFTHLHVDHVGAVPDYPNLSFIVNETEYENNSHAFLLPSWFKPLKVKLNKQVIGDFEESNSLTNKGDMHLVATPGHTKGHCSILLQTDEADILFAGDVVYNIEQLHNNTFAAPNDVKSSLRSYNMIKSHARQRKLIVLPSHDVNALKRLEEKEFLK